MCGIAGLFSPATEGLSPSSRHLLHRMSQAIVHRGPDEGGQHIEPNIALAHRRLSIIDLRTGQQPLFNEDQSVAVVYNGEIYNYRELTQELEAAGHFFRTRCDTEVIVHAWEQWGERCVEHFRGMFAFALWDRSDKVLFLARDRLGVKPLYYSFLRDGSFAFGSELKCLKLLPAFGRKIDAQAVEEYFALGYVPDPRTIYEDTFKLPPGYTLTFRVADRQPKLRRYWDVGFARQRNPSMRDAVAELRERLEEAVRIRLVAEVPIGAFLSGGVDSGTVVALMAHLLETPVKTCSIGFDDAAFDESTHAQAVATRYGSEHHVSMVSSHDFALARHVACLYDEPFADSSAMPTFQVCQLARRHVTVALSGDGGDEAFGGYRRYKLHLMEDRLRSFLPLSMRRALFAPLGNAFPKLDALPRSFRAKTTLQAIGRSSVEAYFNTVSLLRDEDRSRLFTRSFRRRLDGYNAVAVFLGHAALGPSEDALDIVQYLDFKTYLPGDINTKVDRASMANSLEVREPLLDHELVDWICSLPSSMKIRNNDTKILLKAVAKSLLPSQIIERQKMGFAVPMASWFRTTQGKTAIEECTTGRAVSAGYLEPSSLTSMYAQHVSGRRDWSAPLWAVFCFEQFLQQEKEAVAMTVGEASGANA